MKTILTDKNLELAARVLKALGSTLIADAAAQYKPYPGQAYDQLLDSMLLIEAARSNLIKQKRGAK